MHKVSSTRIIYNSLLLNNSRALFPLLVTTDVLDTTCFFSLTTTLATTISINRHRSMASTQNAAADGLDPSKLTRPNWAKSYDTPYFVVHETTDDYELREYEETKWVLTDIENTEGQWEKRDGSSSSFWKLFRYISGNNTASKKIPMTVPVRMEHTLKKVDMAFMVPHHIKDDTPDPTAPDVKVITVPRQLVYCRTFGGYAKGFFGNKNYWKTELESLKSALTRDGKKFDSENFYTIGYDSPYKFYDRHNEVWVSKVED